MTDDYGKRHCKKCRTEKYENNFGLWVCPKCCYEILAGTYKE